MIIKDKNELTPIKQHNKILFKRDDLYQPYEDTKLGGGKVRQMQFLMDSLLQSISNYKGLITHCPLSSPQSLIVAKEANRNGLKSCLIAAGNTTENTILSKYKPIRMANDLGMDIKIVNAYAYPNVLRKRSIEIAERENYFYVQFGINSEEHLASIVNAVANQVENIPDELDAIVVPTGSGMTFFSVMLGVQRFNKKVKRMIAIQIANKDRRKDIDKLKKIYSLNTKYEFYLDSRYKYQKGIDILLSSDFVLNKVYEAKAYEYLLRYKHDMKIKLTDKVLFWCVGNNNFLYDQGNEIKVHKLF
jgi:1-aminocyclopropane-1-carboxylate deaminase/D-cysteine desulfhydrase-like pyridoxal-dependent ACC family enzyme